MRYFMKLPGRTANSLVLHFCAAGLRIPRPIYQRIEPNARARGAHIPHKPSGGDPSPSLARWAQNAMRLGGNLNMLGLLLVLAATFWGFSGTAFAQEGKNAAAVDPVVQQFEQRFGSQLRLVQRTELHFLRMVTQPTKQQYDTIVAATDEEFKGAITQFARVMRQPDLAGQTDPRARYADALLPAARKTLKPEQVASYQQELDERNAARRRMIVKNLVVAVDRLLLLTPQQRAKLQPILARNWDASWNQLQLLLYNGQYFPAMPEKEILPLLTQNQSVLWRATPKANVRFGFNLGLVDGVDPGEEVWDGPQPDKGLKPPDDGGEAEESELELRELVVLGNEQFDQWVFANLGNAGAARQRLEQILAVQVEAIGHGCRLTAAQQKKLQLAGRGDVKRFYDRYTALKTKYQPVMNDQEKVQEIWQALTPLRTQLTAGLFNADSFLQRCVSHTLTREQTTHYEKLTDERRTFRHEANIELVVCMLEQAMPLRATQRRDFIALLMKETQPPRRSGTYDYYALMVRISNLPEEKLQPLLTAPQLKVLRPQWQRYRGMEQQLRAAGQWPEDDEEDKGALKK